MTTITRTECEVADQILRWDEVRDGDLVLHEDTLIVAEKVSVYEDDWQGHKWLRVDITYIGEDGRTYTFDCHGDGYTAVRRYVETEPDTLRQQVKQARDTVYEQACEYSEMAGHEVQEARDHARVSAYDDVLAMLAEAGTGSEGSEGR